MIILPAATGVQNVAPAGLNWPDVHIVQVDAPPSEYVPLGHINGQLILAKAPPKHPNGERIDIRIKTAISKMSLNLSTWIHRLTR